MSLISFSTISDGTTATATQVNTPLTTIYNDYNGNITDANVASAAAIAFSKVSGGSSTALVAWASWTPTFVNWTIGTGGSAGTDAKYVQIGKTVFYRIKSVLGSSGQSVGTGVTFTLPVTSITVPSTNMPIGTMTMTNGGGMHNGFISWDTTTTGRLQNWDVNNDAGGLTSTNPFSWAAGGSIFIEGFYEAA